MDLSRKGEYRIDQVRIARRRKKLDTLAESIAKVEDESIRESFVRETLPLMDRESDEDFDRDVLDLSTRVRKNLQAQRFRSQAQEECERIAHMDPDLTGPVRDLAAQASSQDDVARVKREVKHLLEEEKRALDAEYVQDAVKEVLAELGYDCAEGFQETEFGDVAFASSPDNPGYALRVQVDGEKSNIFGRIVATRETTESQDLRAQERMCPLWQEMADGLKEKGVEVSVRRHTGPGESPVDKTGAQRDLQAGRDRRSKRVRAAAQRRNAR